MPHLDRFGLLAKESLRESRPKLYQALESSGQLEEHLYAAQERAKDVLAELVQGGASWDQAWEVAKDELFLPSEEDQPRLGENVS